MAREAQQSELRRHGEGGREGRGEPFEQLYLVLLRAGGTKDAVALLKPFGLNPKDPAYWGNGMRGSVGALLEEAETLPLKRGFE